VNDETRPILPPPPGEGHQPSGEQAAPPSPYAQPYGQPYGQPYEQAHPQPAGQPYGDPYTAAYPQQPPPGPGGTATDTRSRNRGAFAAAVLAGALVVGGTAGLGGAAAWDEWGSPGADTSTNGPTALQAVDRGDSPAPDGSVEAVAQQVLPSVVQINVAGPQGSGSGSGIILSADGEILTNNHVVEMAKGGGQMSVSFQDGTTADASIVGTDPLTDTAVIQAQDVSGLTPATIGTSGNLDVGQAVVAIGSPFGLESTVTSGIVSALNRAVNVGSDAEGNATTYPAIQTDAAINPGNSGGPLVDMNGDVVGINSSIRTAASSSTEQGGSIGLGFAIPIDEVLPVVDQMRNGETPTHARLGVSVSDVAAQQGQLAASGAQLQSVEAGSTAAQAGLQQGDIITKIDDTEITGADSLVATIRSYRPGDTVTVTWVRDGDEQSAKLTLDSDAG
jgi:putative serine protease PepD